MSKEMKNPTHGADGQRPDTASGQRRFEDLPPPAQRALREAEARRLKEAGKTDPPAEIGGRGGKDPARYGDWEIDGRAIDF